MHTHALADSPQEITRQYYRDGYCIIKGCIDTVHISHITDAMHTLFRLQLHYMDIPASPHTGREAFYDDARALFTADITRYKKTLAASIHVAPMYQLTSSPDILAALHTYLGIQHVLIPSHGILHMMAEELRIPGGYLETPPHQDWMSMQGSLDGVTLWTPLFPMTPGVHPLELVPGSHRQGLLASNKGEHYVVDECMYQEDDFIPLYAEPGDCILFHCFTLHRSGKGTKPGFRAGVSFRYMNMEDPSYIRRTYPNGYRRSVDYSHIDAHMPERDELDALMARFETPVS